MEKFLIKRLFQSVFILFLASMIAFAVIHFAPGDPLYMYTTPGVAQVELSPEEIEQMRQSLGLDGSIVEQYIRWLGNTISGNWGKSVINYRPVLEQIIERIPSTLALMGTGLIISIILAIPLGLISGSNENNFIDQIISFFTYIGISIPQFWLGLILIIIFSMNLKLLPSSGMRTTGVESFWDLAKHAILPVTVLVLNNLAVFIRYIRSSTINELNQDYVLAAKSKGVKHHDILIQHVLRNCLLPFITVVGMNISTLLAGSIVIENVFAWPGLGTLTLNAINNRDYPLVMGTVIISSVVLLAGNLIADILYQIVDPRISLED
ncbi:ABC transporter permease [Facklamia hominis]|uniref:ABC transporter permease n=1 Tax=Facklamia hominis TaxID=178214 RepID=UPI00101DEFBB|nr:ABC transporter permease [Facklamia hominis]RYC97635.1 ABC transporter permease [Facklamia hominis]